MTNEQRELSNRRTRVGGWRSLVGLGAIFIMIVAFSTPVSAQAEASPAQHVTVSGDSEPSDCNNGRGAGAIALTGDLEGCLIFFPGDFTCDELNGFDRVRESGRELFIGSLFGERGKFRTHYDLEATYAAGFCDAVEAGGFPFEMQLTGGCDHYVRGRTGAFRGMKGLITFFDVVPVPGESGASNFLYAGELKTRPRR